MVSPERVHDTQPQADAAACPDFDAAADFTPRPEWRDNQTAMPVGPKATRAKHIHLQYRTDPVHLKDSIARHDSLHAG